MIKEKIKKTPKDRFIGTKVKFQMRIWRSLSDMLSILMLSTILLVIDTRGIVYHFFLDGNDELLIIFNIVIILISMIVSVMLFMEVYLVSLNHEWHINLYKTVFLSILFFLITRQFCFDFSTNNDLSTTFSIILIFIMSCFNLSYTFLLNKYRVAPNEESINELEKDLLNRSHQIHLLKRIILDENTTAYFRQIKTVGIDGLWGIGKTTLIRLTKHKIESSAKWSKKDFFIEVDLAQVLSVRDLFNQIITAYDNKKGLTSYNQKLKLLSKVDTRMSTISDIVIDIDSMTIDHICSTLSKDNQVNGRKVVLILDNLDRINSEQLFQNIIHSLSYLEKIVNLKTILAYNSSNFTQEKSLKTDDIHYEHCLDKYIHLKINLPNVSFPIVSSVYVEELDMMISSDFIIESTDYDERMGSTVKKTLIDKITSCAYELNISRRSFESYLNTIFLINDYWSTLDENARINYGDYLLISFIKETNVSLYSTIKSHKFLLATEWKNKEEQFGQINEFIKIVPNEYKSIVKELFPGIDYLSFETYIPNGFYDERKRIFSAEWFNHYFESSFGYESDDAKFTNIFNEISQSDSYEKDVEEKMISLIMTSNNSNYTFKKLIQSDKSSTYYFEYLISISSKFILSYKSISDPIDRWEFISELDSIIAELASVFPLDNESIILNFIEESLTEISLLEILRTFALFVIRRNINSDLTSQISGQHTAKVEKILEQKDEYNIFDSQLYTPNLVRGLLPVPTETNDQDDTQKIRLKKYIKNLISKEKLYVWLLLIDLLSASRSGSTSKTYYIYYYDSRVHDFLIDVDFISKTARETINVFNEYQDMHIFFNGILQQLYNPRTVGSLTGGYKYDSINAHDLNKYRLKIFDAIDTKNRV